MLLKSAVSGLGIGMLGMAAFGAAAPTLISNGGFEGGAGTDGIPIGWTTYAPNDVAMFAVMTDIKSSGTASACIETTHDINAMLISDPPVAVAPGERLTLRVRCRARDISTSNSGSIVVNSGFLNARSQYVAWKKTRVSTPPAGQWAQIEFGAEVPENAYYATFQTGVKLATGTTWWDDAEMITSTPLAARFHLPQGKVEPGESQVPLVLLNRDPAATNSEVDIRVEPGAKTITRKLAPRVPEATTIPVTVKLNKRGKSALKAVIRQEGRTVFTATRSVTVPPELVLEPLQPTHFCIGDSGPARFKGRLWIHEPASERGKFTVQCELADSAGRKVVDLPPEDSGPNPLSFEMALEGQPSAPGDYTLTARLLRGNEPVSSATQDWHVIHRAQARSHFDDKGRLIVDGKPFFPIGLYMGMRWKEMAGSGFNVTQAYNPFNVPVDGPADNQRIKDFLDAAHGAGYKTLTFVSHSLTDRLDDEQALRRIRTFRNHPATLVWYQEEAVARGIRNVSWLCNHYRMLKKEAPEHPVLMGDMRDTSKNVKDRSTMFPDECMDAGIWWWYPIPTRPKVSAEGWEGEGTDRLELVPPTFLTLAKTQKTLWVAVQCYRKPDLADGRFPTPEEYRAQAYISIIHGAKGLFYYTGVGEQNMGVLNKPEEGHWDYLKELSLELKEMSPVFLAADAAERVDVVEPTSAPVSVRLKQVGSKTVLLAANRVATPLKATIRGNFIKAGPIPARFENRSVEVHKPGEFTDTFDKYAVHVYDLE